ncbi:glycosyltransferase [bacterium]|nr:glycosyltransferase [bacterium]
MDPENPDGKSVRVLFVCSGRSRETISPIVSAQGESIDRAGAVTDYFPVGGNGFLSYLAAIVLLRKKLREVRPDIIHAHYALSAFVALAARRRTPLVVSFMGDDILGTNRQDGSKTLTSRIFAIVNALFARWFYDFVIVKSPEMHARLRPGTRAEIVPNGVDMKTFYPMNRAEAQKLTGFDPGKRNFLFIADPSRPEKNYGLAEEAVRAAGSGNQLHIIRDKKPPELRVFYCAADAVLLTSFHEGSPNIIKEAMACNCPVVSTDAGDVRILSDGVAGNFLTGYESSDVAAKLTAAGKFRSDSGETGGREKIMEMNLDSVSVAERIISIYRELLQSRQPGS